MGQTGATLSKFACNGMGDARADVGTFLFKKSIVRFMKPGKIQNGIFMPLKVDN